MLGAVIIRLSSSRGSHTRAGKDPHQICGSFTDPWLSRKDDTAFVPDRQEA